MLFLARDLHPRSEIKNQPSLTAVSPQVYDTDPLTELEEEGVGYMVCVEEAVREVLEVSEVDEVGVGCGAVRRVQRGLAVRAAASHTTEVSGGGCGAA